MFTRYLSFFFKDDGRCPDTNLNVGCDVDSSTNDPTGDPTGDPTEGPDSGVESMEPRIVYLLTVFIISIFVF